MNMFNFFCWPNTSRWSKASKCKKMIKRARCRLIQLKKRRHVIAMQLRKDLAELTQIGHEEIAIKRVEQFIQDERLVSAYELLDHLFVFILKKFSYIQRNKDCPPDINEAVSSLIFASARCGNFPELYTIRKLFGQHYGQDFATAAVELFPGNLVNQKLIENLSVMTVSNDQKYMVVDEITKDNCLQPEAAPIDHTIAECKINPSEVEETDSDDTSICSSISKPSDSFSLPESTSTETSALVSSVHQYLTYPPLQKEAEEKDFDDLQNKGGIMALAPSLYYVDEIEQHHSFVPQDGYNQDQKLSLIVYYKNPSKSSSTQKYEEMRLKQDVLEKENCIQSCQSQGNTKRNGFNLDMCDCSLDQPCYSRAFTMAPVWPENREDNLLRISQQPKHVHPRLQEFEDIVTAFTTLKNEIVCGYKINTATTLKQEGLI